VWHFFHEADRDGCSAGETIAHLEGKAELYRTLRRAIDDPEHKVSISRICLNPDCSIGIHMQEMKLHGNNYTVEIEHSFDIDGYKFRADVALINPKWEVPFVFEVYHSNPVNSAKASKWDDSGIHWLEIKADRISHLMTEILPLQSGNKLSVGVKECKYYLPPEPPEPPEQEQRVDKAERLKQERLWVKNGRDTLVKYGWEKYKGWIVVRELSWWNSSVSKPKFFYDVERRKVWFDFEWKTGKQGYYIERIIGQQLNYLEDQGFGSDIDWSKVKTSYKVDIKRINLQRRKLFFEVDLTGNWQNK
tara:strand:- start:2594 stop:3505 length:912 start_codon:yes stop_codon:yes gene_type:complete